MLIALGSCYTKRLAVAGLCCNDDVLCAVCCCCCCVCVLVASFAHDLNPSVFAGNCSETCFEYAFGKKKCPEVQSGKIRSSRWSAVVENVGIFFSRSVGCGKVWYITIQTTRNRNVCRVLKPFPSDDEYPICPPSTTTSSTDGQQADAQYEPNPACWGAVRAGADWSLSSLSITPTVTSRKNGKHTKNSARKHFIAGNNKIYSMCSQRIVRSIAVPHRCVSFVWSSWAWSP